MPNLVMIIFYCILGAYLLGLSIFVLIVRHRNKKKVLKELQEYDKAKSEEVI